MYVLHHDPFIVRLSPQFDYLIAKTNSLWWSLGPCHYGDGKLEVGSHCLVMTIMILLCHGWAMNRWSNLFLLIGMRGTNIWYPTHWQLKLVISWARNHEVLLSANAGVVHTDDGHDKSSPGNQFYMEFCLSSAMGKSIVCVSMCVCVCQCPNS